MKKKKDYVFGFSFVNPNIMESVDGGFDKSRIKVTMTDTGPSYFIPEVICTTVGVVSINGLECSEEELQHMISKPMWQHRIEKGEKILGELDHPAKSDGPERLRVVNMDKAAIALSNFKFKVIDGAKHLVADVTTLANKSGLVLANLIQLGIGFGLSMRASATIIPGRGTPSKPFKDINLTTYDAVFNPSNKESWITRIMECAVLEDAIELLENEFEPYTADNGNMAFSTSRSELCEFICESVNGMHKNVTAFRPVLDLIESVNVRGFEDILEFTSVVDIDKNTHVVEIRESAESFGFTPTHMILLESQTGEGSSLFMKEKLTDETVMIMEAVNHAKSSIRNKILMM